MSDPTTPSPESDDLELLPEKSADESSIGWGDVADDIDRHYLEERPPHHGD